ncbi:hypothetical protein NE237_028305 [Protea cynaroides]|uniref:Uncharacterized protein n=1 Tax=Protea cynaroides TaxID=273540 RepID=A0A9Q0GRS0_9MAGN|nr:hypothetical protein NE237_028305 [Protea cynaroides]
MWLTKKARLHLNQITSKTEHMWPTKKTRIHLSRITSNTEHIWPTKKARLQLSGITSKDRAYLANQALTWPCISTKHLWPIKEARQGASTGLSFPTLETLGLDELWKFERLKGSQLQDCLLKEGRIREEPATKDNTVEGRWSGRRRRRIRFVEDFIDSAMRNAMKPTSSTSAIPQTSTLNPHLRRHRLHDHHLHRHHNREEKRSYGSVSSLLLCAIGICRSSSILDTDLKKFVDSRHTNLKKLIDSHRRGPNPRPLPTSVVQKGHVVSLLVHFLTDS